MILHREYNFPNRNNNTYFLIIRLPFFHCTTIRLGQYSHYIIHNTLHYIEFNVLKCFNTVFDQSSRKYDVSKILPWHSRRLLRLLRPGPPLPNMPISAMYCMPAAFNDMECHFQTVHNWNTFKMGSLFWYAKVPKKSYTYNMIYISVPVTQRAPERVPVHGDRRRAVPRYDALQHRGQSLVQLTALGLLTRHLQWRSSSSVHYSELKLKVMFYPRRIEVM